MTPPTRNRSSPRPPLNSASLQELALRYVGKYATTRFKLRSYLLRKIRERGWDGPGEADVNEIASHLAELGYIDDAGFALGQSRALAARGYGKRRLTQKLRLAGVEDADGEAAKVLADDQSAEAAIRFAQKRRIGPFADGSTTALDPRQRDRWIAAMIRAGHDYALARTLVALPPGGAIDADVLREIFEQRNA